MVLGEGLKFVMHSHAKEDPDGIEDSEIDINLPGESKKVP